MDTLFEVNSTLQWFSDAASLNPHTLTKVVEIIADNMIKCLGDGPNYAPIFWTIIYDALMISIEPEHD